MGLEFGHSFKVILIIYSIKWAKKSLGPPPAPNKSMQGVGYTNLKLSHSCIMQCDATAPIHYEKQACLLAAPVFIES